MSVIVRRGWLEKRGETMGFYHARYVHLTDAAFVVFGDEKGAVAGAKPTTVISFTHKANVSTSDSASSTDQTAFKIEITYKSGSPIEYFFKAANPAERSQWIYDINVVLKQLPIDEEHLQEETDARRRILKNSGLPDSDIEERIGAFVFRKRLDSWQCRTAIGAAVDPLPDDDTIAPTDWRRGYIVTSRMPVGKFGLHVVDKRPLDGVLVPVDSVVDVIMAVEGQEMVSNEKDAIESFQIKVYEAFRRKEPVIRITVWNWKTDERRAVDLPVKRGDGVLSPTSYMMLKIVGFEMSMLDKRASLTGANLSITPSSSPAKSDVIQAPPRSPAVMTAASMRDEEIINMRAEFMKLQVEFSNVQERYQQDISRIQVEMKKLEMRMTALESTTAVPPPNLIPK